jgi:hypothetical protein
MIPLQCTFAAKRSLVQVVNFAGGYVLEEERMKAHVVRIWKLLFDTGQRRIGVRCDSAAQ